MRAMHSILARASNHRAREWRQFWHVTAGLLLLTAATYRLPPEHAIDVGEGADAALVTANCAGCHSLDYITNQPQLGQAGWTAEVAKMRTVYGASLDDDTARRIAATLAARKVS